MYIDKRIDELWTSMVEFEWDDAKDRANIAKHGLGFDRASRIFVGPVLTFADERDYDGEYREISIGMLESAAIIVVAHTDRQGRFRIVSARPATSRERKRYAKALRQGIVD